MSKLEELIKEFCPNGVEYKRIGDIGRVAMCKRIMKSDTASEGDVPFYKIGTFGGKADAYINRDKYEEYRAKYSYPKKGDILISAAGTIGKTVIFDGEPAYFQDSNIVWLEHDESIVLNKYLYYVYQTNPWNVSTGGTISRLYNDNITNAIIPLPALPVQREIVRILDSFTLYSAELTAELTARRKQYEYYRDKLLLGNGIGLQEITILDMLSQPITDGPHETPEFVNEGVPFLSAEAIVDNRLDFSRKRGNVTKEYDLICARKYKPRKGDVFMCKSGSTTGKVAINDTDIDFNIWSPLAAMRVNSNHSAKFLYYLLQSADVQNQVKMNASHGSQPNLSMRKLEQFRVKVPPMEVQERIVKVLDNFDVICSDLGIGLPAEIEKRQKQYEYYRDKLLTF